MIAARRSSAPPARLRASMPFRALAALGVALGVVACSKAPDPAAVRAPTAAGASPPAAAVHAVPPAAQDSASAETGVAWRKDDVDAAFATARAENKPLFLYWGAVWCPPCNQVKATLFNRQDFIDRSRFFIPVYIDGDGKSAQRLGARFKVSGYPTMILFNPDGTEITRLPGEVDADQYMRVLAMGMNGARPVKSTLAAALAARKGGTVAKLTPEDWRMLAYYSWETNEEQLVAVKDLPSTLSRLAQACPADQEATATRLQLKAIAAAAAAKDAKPADDKAARERLLKVLADPAIAREHFDVVTDEPAKVIGHVTLPDSKERAALAAAWDLALVRLIGDARLSAADRLGAVAARVDIAKLDSPKGALPDTLLASVREQVARGDKETADPYAREVVINEAANVLAEAGLFEESDSAAHRGARALAHTVLPHAGPRREREEARRQGGRGRVDGESVRRGERSRDASAVGRRLRQHADRSRARRCGAHRARGDPGDRRARAGSRYVLRPQSQVAREDGEKAPRLEQRQRARRSVAPHSRAARSVSARSCLPATPPGLRATACGVRRRADAPEAKAPRAGESRRRFGRRRKHGRHAHCAHDQRLDTTADRDLDARHGIGR